MYKLGGKTFKTKAAAQAEAKRILNETPLYKELSAQDTSFMLAWFELTHENPALKFGSGIKRISVRINKNHPTRGFWLTRVDGTETDISYLPSKSKRSKVVSALRTAVADTIQQYKNKHNVPVDMHIDHAGAWPFSRIVSEFEILLMRKIDDLKTKPHGDGDDIHELADKEIAKRFKNFHDRMAVLEHIPAKDNMAKGDKGRMIGQTIPTSFGGRATITAYNGQSDRYITKTGLTWVFDNDILKMPPECMP